MPNPEEASAPGQITEAEPCLQSLLCVTLKRSNSFTLSCHHPTHNCNHAHLGLAPFILTEDVEGGAEPGMTPD